MDYDNLSREELEAEKAATEAAVREYEGYLSQVLAELAGYVSEVRQAGLLVADPEGWQYIVSTQEQVAGYHQYLNELASQVTTLTQRINRMA